MNRPVRTKMSEQAMSVVGIPKNLFHKTIADFETFGSGDLKEVKEFISEYLSHMDSNFEENKGIFLYGSNGVGKTFVASMIAKEAYRRRFSTKRVSFADYVQEYTRVWEARGRDEREELETVLYTEYKAVEFLVLEEIGKEIDSKIAAPILEDLLRYREDKALPTIICTNLDMETVLERYGISIASLIKGNETPILIEGKDKRSKFYTKRTK